MASVINISAYKFTPLDDLLGLKQRLLNVATTLSLKGTVLLSPEGINVFVAGETSAVEAFVRLLQSLRGLEDLQPKSSESAVQPFGRMRVRIKKEIIALEETGIDHAKTPAHNLAPHLLKQRLDDA